MKAQPTSGSITIFPTRIRSLLASATIKRLTSSLVVRRRGRKRTPSAATSTSTITGATLPSPKPTFSPRTHQPVQRRLQPHLQPHSFVRHRQLRGCESSAFQAPIWERSAIRITGYPASLNQSNKDCISCGLTSFQMSSVLCPSAIADTLRTRAGRTSTPFPTRLMSSAANTISASALLIAPKK